MTEQQLTVDDLLQRLKIAQEKKESFTCASCGWTGAEPLLLDYDEQGPHLECPSCREKLSDV